MNIKNKILYNEIRTLSGYSLDSETSCLRVSGDDASKFLQGQLSNDINLIDDNNYQICLIIGVSKPLKRNLHCKVYESSQEE